MTTREDAARLRQEFPGLSVGFGPQGLVDVATLPDADVVLGGIVGIGRPRARYEAVRLGKTLALANKETLVVAGEPLMERGARRRRGGPARGLASTARSIRPCARARPPR